MTSTKDALEALDRLSRRISDIDGVYSWDDDCEKIRHALAKPVDDAELNEAVNSIKNQIYETPSCSHHAGDVEITIFQAKAILKAVETYTEYKSMDWLEAVLRLKNAAKRLRNGDAITHNLKSFAIDIETLIRAATATKHPDIAEKLAGALKVHHEFCIKNGHGYSEYGEDAVAFRTTKQALTAYESSKSSTKQGGE